MQNYSSHKICLLDLPLMNKAFFYIKTQFWFFILLCFGLCQVPFAQQNLFNVPSSDITDTGKVFFQQQLNVNGFTTSNTTLTFGFKHQFECGINLFGVNYDNKKGGFVKNDATFSNPVGPTVLFNAQKGFILNHHFKIGIGTQDGINLTSYGKKVKGVTFDFINFVYSPIHTLKINAGAYYGNQYFLGDGNKFGGMAGVEWELIGKKFHLMADWIYGTNSFGVAVPGCVWFLTKDISLSFGWQIPNPKSTNPQAFVFEFTYHKA